MLRSYLPVLVFTGLGVFVGAAFTMLNRLLGPSRPNRVKNEPYECGLPSEFTRDFRFGISFYMVAMLFLVFGVEIIFLYPVAITLGLTESVYALVAIALFIALLLVAFVYEWARGGLDWRH